MPKIQKTFIVNGMHCAACSANVQNTINKTPGVVFGNVNLLTKKMIVEYESDELTVQDIKNKIASIGYEAILSTDLQNEDNGHNKRKLNLLISLICGIPLIVFVMGAMFDIDLFVKIALYKNGIYYIIGQIILSLAIIIINFHYFTSGFKNLFKLHPNMDSLIAIGATTAFIYSIINFANLYLFNDYILSKHQIIHGFYFETAGMILTIVSIGKYLESLATLKATSSLTKLLELIPLECNVVDEKGNINYKSINEVKVNDIVLVKPGEKIPLDGVIIEGSTYVDESSITGESIPVLKNKADTVTIASINKFGSIKVRVTNEIGNTWLDNVVKLVEDAANSKSKIERIADKISLYFVPSIILISIITFIAWFILSNDLSKAISSSISVLVIACPCSLGLATPTSIMVGMGLSAQNNILFKNADSLENLGKIKTLILDKTGTITKGNVKVEEVKSFSKLSVQEIIQIVYSIERYSTHPLAKAIVEYGLNKNISSYEISEFNQLAGLGVSAKIDNITYYLGNKQFIEQVLNKEITIIDTNHSTVLLCSNELLGGVYLFDEIKENAKMALKSLNNVKIETVVATGDNLSVTKSICEKLEITSYHANLLPEDKIQIVKNYQQNNQLVGMIGDGINDSAAIALSDVGISLGAGTDIAKEAADVIIQKNDLIDVYNAVIISKNVLRNIKQNLFWALIYNIIALLMTTGLYYLITGKPFNPMFGALAMSLSSICVVTNALRLKNIKLLHPKSNESELNIMKKTVIVEGMMCPMCEKHVRNALEALGNTKATPSHLTKEVIIESTNDSLTNELIKETIEKAGYQVIEIK